MIGIIIGCIAFVLLVVEIIVFLIVHNRKEAPNPSIRHIESNEKGTYTELTEQVEIGNFSLKEDDQ